MTGASAPVRRALLSVSDKTGLAEFAAGLAAAGAELISTGGTAAALRAAGLAVTEVADVTGAAEMLDGRVKTLHPAVHGGLLARRDLPEHMEALAARGIAPIDLLAVNLYPFEATAASGAGRAETVEEIDIGGPAMIRAAAKNHADVAVLVDPADYDAVLAEIGATGGTSAETRRRLALTAFGRTAAYDAAIAAWMAETDGVADPPWRAFAGRHAATLRYGENPHQHAALYLTGAARPGAATARVVQGKALSHNNLLDTDAAYELVAEFGEGPAVAIIKHANPCGVALGETLEAAYRAARRCDPVSAFGGIVAVNRPLDAATAAAIAEIVTEVVIAPGLLPGAAEALAARPALRLLDAGALPDPAAPGTAVRQIAGGLLVQDRDAAPVPDLRVVTRRAPDARELADLRFAWRVAKHVKSNAIVYARDGATVGIGAGQMSRVDSSRIAARKAEDIMAAEGLAELPTRGAAVASDAFFPFADGLLAAAEAGATAIIQPGGSVRDEEVIAAADAQNLAMVFTGQRHFRH
ncbi:MAG: bifunctional phosphoribosylaminoimidazolecarboxamide formyltransferase/IMP cyclohydrolase [Pseudomonadota bacterium]